VEFEDCYERREFVRVGKHSIPFISLEDLKSRVESNGRLSPVPLLPLVEPDVRISRIRLSCKHFVRGAVVPILANIGSGSSLSDGGICADFGG